MGMQASAPNVIDKVRTMQYASMGCPSQPMN
jgi:hypothetical protein